MLHSPSESRFNTHSGRLKQRHMQNKRPSGLRAGLSRRKTTRRNREISALDRRQFPLDQWGERLRERAATTAGSGKLGKISRQLPHLLPASEKPSSYFPRFGNRRHGTDRRKPAHTTVPPKQSRRSLHCHHPFPMRGKKSSKHWKNWSTASAH